MKVLTGDTEDWSQWLITVWTNYCWRNNILQSLSGKLRAQTNISEWLILIKPIIRYLILHFKQCLMLDKTYYPFICLRILPLQLAKFFCPGQLCLCYWIENPVMSSCNSRIIVCSTCSIKNKEILFEYKNLCLLIKIFGKYCQLF